MDATELQVEINSMLVRYGMRNEAGTEGLECTPSSHRSDFGLPSLTIRSIALNIVKPYTEWWSAGHLMTIEVARGAQARPKIISWETSSLPSYMPVTSVDKSGKTYTLNLLGHALLELREQLNGVLINAGESEVTLSKRLALLDVYLGVGDDLLVRDEGSTYTNSEAARWVSEDIRSEIIVYCFANPFRWSTLVRQHRKPLLTLEQARELNAVSLRRIAALYPLEELAK